MGIPVGTMGGHGVMGDCGKSGDHGVMGGPCGDHRGYADYGTAMGGQGPWWAGRNPQILGYP